MGLMCPATGVPGETSRSHTACILVPFPAQPIDSKVGLLGYLHASSRRPDYLTAT